MSKYRTHNCNELRLSDVGKQVKIAGFVETIRDLGGLVFLDIRDMYGITQVVTSAEDKDVDFASHIPIESSVCVTGIVKKRDPETYNPNIETGEVEVKIENIEILGKRTKNLPFEVNTDQDVREDLRLQYRFLDLRNKKLQQNLILRAQVIQYLRSQMIEQGFLEVQTPILTSSSPEGARDYLVPSRVHPGKFYALPQAPQQFKQLLMVSGIDKYFQIAPCFRDEDARADRAPGEFYQLDMEMAYATQEDVFNVMEPVIYNTFKKFSDKKIAQHPFPRISYKETMLKYINTFDDVLTRNNEFGHFTASSWVVNKERTKVLMIYHNIYKSWSWTGGHADGESDLLQTAIRELKEETGIKNVKILDDNIFSLEIICVDGHVKRGKCVSSHVHLNLTYLLEVDENEDLKIKRDENSGVRWVNIEDVEKVVTEKWVAENVYRKLNEKLKNIKEA